MIVLSAPLLLGKAILEIDNSSLYTARTVSESTEVWIVRNEDVEKSMQADVTLSYKFYTYFTSLMVKWTVDRRNRRKPKGSAEPGPPNRIMSRYFLEGSIQSSSIRDIPTLTSHEVRTIPSETDNLRVTRGAPRF